jgi:5-hydroxyisourate hydrolase
MSRITTHVLDTVLGKPAAAVAVRLEEHKESAWNIIGQSITDGDGRCRDLAGEINSGYYRLTFETAAYFEKAGRRSLYPEVTITFKCVKEEDYHLPLLLSDNSYTTYRGS